MPRARPTRYGIFVLFRGKPWPGAPLGRCYAARDLEPA
jgi:hypothetical protein